MLKILSRCGQYFGTATTFASSSQTLLLQRLRYFASFTLRDVLHESSDETGTLVARFAKHIAIERYNMERDLVPTTIRYADFFPITDERYFQNELDKIAADQLPALIIYASSYRSNAQPVKYVFLLKELDNAAVKHLNNMNMDTVLETLYSFLFLLPNWITRLDFYQSALQRLVSQDFDEKPSKEAFVQLCFYMGLQKKSKIINLEQFLQKHLNTYLPKLNYLDLALVCNAAYKASIVLENNKDYEQRLIDAVLKLPLEGANDALIITYLKSLRLQRVKSEEICHHLTEFCKQPKQLSQIQPRGLAHLLSFFVEQQWDNEHCKKAILSEFLKHLNIRNSNRTLRAKDLATFVWGFAQLNCQLKETELELIEQLTLNKLDNNEYRYFPDNLVDTCLSLWMLGKQSRDLLNAAVELKSIQNNRNARAQPKVDSRLTVLLSAASIEQPEWTNNLTTTPAYKKTATAPAHLLKERANLKQLAAQLSKEAEVKAAKLVCPINGINIPSLLLQSADGSEFFVELIDDNQRLKFSQLPSALIRLKVRLLEALGNNVIQLSTEQPEDVYKNLKELLLNNAEVCETSTPKTAHSISSQ